MRTQDDGCGTIGSGTTLKFGHEFVLDGGGEDLLEGVYVVELRVGVIYTEVSTHTSTVIWARERGEGENETGGGGRWHV